MTNVLYFDKVSDKTQETAPAAVVNNGCGNQTVPAWTAPYTGPAQMRASFIPIEEKTFHYDPSKGRSFKKAQRRGEILMSEYLTGTDRTERFISSIRHEFKHASYTSTGKCQRTQLCAVYGPVPVYAKWTENYHIGMLSTLAHAGKTIADIQKEVPDLVSSTRQAAYSSALNAYDLLTELGELKETLGFLLGKLGEVASLVGLFAAKSGEYRRWRRFTPKALLRSSDKGARELGHRWMEYRYALMPILYSIADVGRLVKAMRARFHTDRAVQHIDIPITSDVVGVEQYLTTQVRGYVRVASTTKAAFDLGSLQVLLSRVGFNPFRTAWELIPLSFVVDWAFNIGECITALTGVDLASQRKGCTSVRSNLTSETYHHYDVHDSVVWSWAPNACGYSPSPWDYHRRVTYHNLVERRVINSYVRSLWVHPNADIVFDPFLNWKRFVDAIVLSYQPTKNLLRSLK